MYPSIFGEVTRGVPNPYVPHRHPYPTRYHGPIYTVPRFGNRYHERPNYVPPGLAASPDGLGETTLPMITRSAIADALIGAFVGWLGAPDRSDAIMYAVGGAAATGLGGAVGLGALLSFELYQAQQRGGLRADLHK